MQYPALFLFLGGCLLAAQPIDIPLTIDEPAGVARSAEPVTAGVPLPKGALRDAATLRLFDPDGKAVPAHFRPVNFWGDDRSIQWVHVDFFANAPAGGRAVYRVRTSTVPAPAPSATLAVEASPDAVRVNTGTVTFTAHRNGPFLDAGALRGADFLLRSDERIYKASQWERSSLIVEEQSPLRVVLKRTGSHGWVDREDRALDYVLRIVAYAGQSHVRLIHSFVNRQGREMSDFVRLDGLWLQARLTGAAQPFAVEQLGAEPRRTGWFEAGGIGVGLRWFWQLYPKGFAVQPGGLMRLALFPETARPQNIYTGVAKTHEILLSLDGRNLSAHLDDPVYAVAPPKWYTRDTKALGRLVESSPEAILPKYWPLVQRYDRWLADSRDAVLKKRDSGFTFQGRRYDEYGMLNFGDAMHKLIADDAKPDYGIHWETEYYDFPHALFLHFFRTGDMKSFRMAIEAAAHLADVDISHYEIDPTRHGAARTGPGLNHWTRYSNGVFISSTSWAFYKNESLFDRWLLTGDLWSRDVARLSSGFGTEYNGLDLHSNTRSIGHGLFAMLKAWEVFGEKKYLDRVHWIVDCVQAWQDGNVQELARLNPRVVWDPVFKGGYSHQSWMYGIALEGMAQASQALGRPEMPGYMRRAADWIFANPREWDPARRRFRNAPVHSVMLTPGLAYIAETSGEKKYWDVALESFEWQTQEAKVTDRLKLFAQLFRNSQRFPWYLSVEANGARHGGERP
ncbi:MAG: glycoside hydrolase family 127 protein [Bryobacterales bacterium]|nr:glycoside hydrolase family 127 protein [Bryobacterales bacterium]